LNFKAAKNDDTRESVVRDQNGEALGSLCSAAATLSALRDSENNRSMAEKNMAKGWVYV
jgi:hypothetical protein